MAAPDSALDVATTDTVGPHLSSASRGCRVWLACPPTVSRAQAAVHNARTVCAARNLPDLDLAIIFGEHSLLCDLPPWPLRVTELW